MDVFNDDEEERTEQRDEVEMFICSFKSMACSLHVTVGPDHGSIKVPVE